MDIHELEQFESVYKPSREVAFCWLIKKYVQLSTEEDHTEIVNHANDSLRIWKAAKTQAVPEGFVLIPKKLPDELNDQLWDFMTDNFVCVNDDGDSFMACDDFDLDKLYDELIESQGPNQPTQFNLDEFLSMEEKLKSKGGIIKADFDRFIAYAEMVLEKAKAHRSQNDH